MLKKFFIAMLGTMAGIWLTIILTIIGGLLLAGAIAGSSDNGEIKRHSILYLDLSGDIAERYQPTSLIEMLRAADNDAPALDEMLGALSRAAGDDRIEAVWLDCGGSAMGMASRQELLEAINDFKANSGKPVYAYADAYAQGDFILAAAADSVFLNPIGAVDIHGLGGVVPFFATTLDKLGIKMQIVKVGTFKSAVEPYILTHISEPARLQMQQYVDSLWLFASTAIADGRSLDRDSILVWAPQMISTLPAARMQEMGLVDALAYRRQFENSLRAASGLNDDEELRTVAPAEYLAAADVLAALNAAKPHVAVLYAVGDIVDSGDGGIVGDDMVPEIIDLADDDNVRGLVLRVNSGGGSAFASEQIWEALEYFKSKNKPFYVSMGDYAASGGYYISCGADRIYADATTITGSIGVFGIIPDFSGLVTDKLGVNFSTVESNANAIGISLYEPMTPSQHAAMQRSVEDIYSLFTSRVADGRGLDVDSVRTIGEGRVWVGSRALELGLVDELGSLADAVAAMTAATDLGDNDVVSYPVEEEEMLVRILREAGAGNISEAATGLKADAETMQYLHFVRSLRTMNPVQARMETVVIR